MADVGRPSEYRDEFVEQARAMCEAGATDQEIADELQVDVSTIYRWKIRHPEFCEAIKNGKEVVDERVERSLYQKAIGGDVVAQIFWLKNRRKENWRDKQEIEHSASGDLAAIIAGRRARVAEMNADGE